MNEVKYIFIDTNLFFDILTCNEGEKILDAIVRQLDKKGSILLLPEVIKIEILTEYDRWKQSITDKVKLNLDTKNILGVKDELTDSNKNKKKKEQQGETEAEKIDGIIDSHREAMKKAITEYYESISLKIDQIFKHKNTQNLELTDQALLAGMKRSVLKKPPYTRADKKTENAHTKDIDCIAFEILAIFFRENLNKNGKNILIMCVSDKDYFSTNKTLHPDLKIDELESRVYQTIVEMLEKEFHENLSDKKANQVKKEQNLIGSLAGSDDALVQGSGIITPSVL